MVKPTTHAWVVGRGVRVEGNIKEGVKLEHIPAHIVCPFQDLGTYVNKESVG
jgi:hypothetical protein